MKRKTKRAFDTVCELASGPGLVGCLLKDLATFTAPLGSTLVPDWLLREADRWKNPWEFLLGVRDLPKVFRLLFAAAHSQKGALRQFTHKAQKTGSLSTSCYDRLLAAVKNRDAQAQLTASKRTFAGMYRVDRGRFLLAACKKSRELRRRFRNG